MVAGSIEVVLENANAAGASWYEVVATRQGSDGTPPRRTHILGRHARGKLVGLAAGPWKVDLAVRGPGRSRTPLISQVVEVSGGRQARVVFLLP